MYSVNNKTLYSVSYTCKKEVYKVLKTWKKSWSIVFKSPGWVLKQSVYKVDDNVWKNRLVWFQLWLIILSQFRRFFFQINSRNVLHRLISLWNLCNVLPMLPIWFDALRILTIQDLIILLKHCIYLVACNLLDILITLMAVLIIHKKPDPMYGNSSPVICSPWWLMKGWMA